ncbi:hypothetical protein [Streptomyces sp. NPDC056160]|uniref:hypothetical protein n=1 Tax=Streptomyces sp. NPDC056160 TaxID=3345731 RepID=UPI0035E1177D
MAVAPPRALVVVPTCHERDDLPVLTGLLADLPVPTRRPGSHPSREYRTAFLTPASTSVRECPASACPVTAVSGRPVAAERIS